MKTIGLFAFTILFYFNSFAQNSSSKGDAVLTESVQTESKDIKHSTKNYRFYPHPVDNIVTLVPKTLFKGYAEICSIEGIVIKKTRLKSEEILDIDIRNLSAGHYFIKISDHNFQPTEVLKFFKQ